MVFGNKVRREARESPCRWKMAGAAAAEEDVYSGMHLRRRSRGVAGVAHPPEMDARDEERLYYAIDLDDSVLLRTAIEVGGIDASSRFPGHLGKSALQLCCEKGRLDCARLLLEAGADTEAQDDWFHTPLVSSVSTGRCDMVRLLVNAGCNTEIKDKFGKTAIHYAVNDCETGCLAELIKASADVNALDVNGRVPVWLAAESDGRVEYMKMLVQANCDVNVKDKREKRTPLQVAILKSSVDLVNYVKILLEAGAQTDVVDLLGMSPMTCLIQRVSTIPSHGEIQHIEQKYMDVARLLLEAGYDVNFTSAAHYNFQFHGTSLKMAVDRGVIPIVQLLLEFGADPDACDDKNATPLLVAVCHDFRQIGKLLIRANCALFAPADVTLSGHVHSHVTPLGCAVILGHAEFVELLLAAGYDVKQEPASLLDLVTSKQSDMSEVTSPSQTMTSLIIDKDMEERLRYWYRNPRSLAMMCRSVARSLLGKDIERKVKGLPLPIGVKNNLLLVNVI